MKRALVAALALACSAGFAAETGTSPLRVGGQVGANLGNVSISPAIAGLTKKSNTGFLVGANVDYWLADMFYVGADVMYFQHGTKLGILGTESKVKLDAIKVPVLAKFLYPVAPGFKIGLVAGPWVSFIMSAKVGGVDAKNNFKKTAFGIDAGLATELEIDAKIAAFLDVRYGLGLSDVNKDPTITSKVKPQDIQVLAGARFVL